MARLTEVPDRINAGTSVELTLGWPDYPANGGWSLSLIFSGPVANQLALAGSANGASFDITLSAANTQTLGTGATTDGLGMHWVARVTKSGDVKDAEEGDLIVDPDPATAGAYLSHAEKDLAAVNSVINGRITADIEAYQIAGRAVTKIPLKDLMALRSSLEARVAAERRGGAFGPVILPRLVPAS